MPKDNLYNSNISEINKGIYMDCDPLNQPKGTRRYTLNAVEQVIDGKNKVSNEPSIAISTSFTEGFTCIGSRYIGNDNIFTISTGNNGIDELGIIDANNSYTTLVSTSVLGLSIRNQCDIIYRLRQSKERVVYWVDSNNLIRTFNIDRPQNFYNETYSLYLKSGGNPDSFVGDKWDVNSFNLIKTYSEVPFFGAVTVVESGNILPGSYNFAIQLVDEDLNPTAWISTSNTVNIYNDTIINAYSRIRGSRNTDNDSQSFPRTNKSIQLNVYNLDQSFPYYRMAIIRAANNIGEVDKVLVSELYSTYDSNFIYSGNDSSLQETSLDSILIDNEIIYAPKHIDQLENRLIVANTKGKGVNWCDFQSFATQIKTDFVTKEVLLNNIDSQPNVKNASSTYLFKGYMPGEAYSMGIVYLFDDGALSPTFHIPGKGPTDTVSQMQLYQIDSFYLDIHNCSTDNYWGRDINSKSLVGNPIRHHRFPYRSDVNKPIVSSTGTITNITKYTLKLVISLNPAYTPSPSYPNDGGTPPVSLVIPYTFNYQVTGAGSTTSFSGMLTESVIDEAIEIIVYDDVNPLSEISGVYGQLDIHSNLYTYQGGTNDRFIITESYTPYILSSSYNDDVAEIFGFSFSNIQKPREDVVGFYIVRNERTDGDKLIIDNAIIGPNTVFQQYVSFGLLMPKQYYTVNNCGRSGSSGKTLVYDTKSMWFFNPEFQFFGNKLDFDGFKIEGTYTQTSVDMPTISDTDGSTCNGGSGSSDQGGTRGVLIQDVQAGTSYNPAINKAKNKDDDGFDLVIGYRNNNIAFTISNTNIVLPAKSRIIYLNAASYQNYNAFTYYNVSVDNKIGMYLSDSDYDNTKLTNTDGSNTNALYYASMIKDNTVAYSDFLTRPYYKEHNNPIMFNDFNIINDFQVFNGDTEISATNIVSSVFYDMVLADRSKKSSLWKIIVGAVLIAASAVAIATGVLAPLGVAIGTAAVGSLVALSVSYGVSLVMSGIKFDQFKNMIDTAYPKGLKDTVTDGGVYETIRDTIGREDDNIRWFADRVSNIYIESSVPFGLRCGLTSGVSDFTDSPQPYSEDEFRSYLTEKLTVLDSNQGSGRLYKGYAGAEVYDMNLDYMRFNKQKIYYHLPTEYDCCSDFKEEYPLRRWYSEQSFQEEKIDNYRVFLPNSYSDMEGEHGEITDLYRLGNNLFVHTREALWQQPANLQERVTDEIVSFIGTGSFLSIPPRKVIDSDLGSGGTQHKWATVKTKIGVFSISEIENSIYVNGESIKSLNTGLNSYFRENIRSFLSSQIYNEFGIIYANDNNPCNPNGIGYTSGYDVKYDRVVFTKKDFLILPDKLSILQVVNIKPIDGQDFRYNTQDGLFYLGIVVVSLSNKDYFQNKSLTLSYSIGEKFWVSWHSYLPDYYINGKSNLFACKDNNNVWVFNQIGSYGSFFNNQYSFIIEKVSINNPLQDSMYEDMVIQTNARQWDSVKQHYINNRYITFTSILLYNNYQVSKELQLIVKETQVNPQNWYQQQTTNNPDSILISKSGEDWNLNEFRNYVSDYTKSVFSSSWDDIKDVYFTDKVVNVDSTTDTKNWYELETFSDKFIIIRLIFNNFNGVNLGFNYSIDTQQIKE